MAWTSPISKVLESGGYNNITMKPNEMGWTGSFVTLGAMLTCVPMGIICDLIGRRYALLLLIIPYSVGWSLIIWARSLLVLYIGRFITGMAAGACCVVAPLYTTEIAEKEIRGKLGSYFQLMTTVGIFLAYVVGKFDDPMHYTLVCASIPLVFFLCFFFQPETPVYNLKRGRIEAARNSLLRLRGSAYNVDAELLTMQLELDSLAHTTVPTSSVLEKKASRKALIIALGLMFFQQMSGINAIIFYTGDIFEDAGAKIDVKTAAILVGGFQVVSTFVSSLIIDRLGRKVLLITSGVTMSICTTLLGMYFSLKDHSLVSDHTLAALGFLPIVSLCVFMIMFSLGLGPIPWVIASEICTPEFKSTVTSAGGMLNWFLAFLVTKFYFQLDTAIGGDVMFYIFSVCSISGAVFTYFVIPETKGKSLHQIQDELEA